RAVGRGKALEMLLTSRWIGADEALQAGLVNKVVSGDRLLPLAEEVATQIAACDPLIIRVTKQAVLRGLNLPLTQGLELEKRLASKLTPDAKAIK
ncbi:MAG: enoyl-CoA hydratase, partial [Deltaproteobacteria bacterium]|nr:enoyl-CoA hydratase [Deltaproteobacteria bacterium]